MFALFYQITNAQICDKKTTVFFESGESSISSAEQKKLIALSSQFKEKTDTFLLEIYSFSDSIASVEYNYKLAQKRLNSIVNYLRKKSEAHFDIIKKIRGEAAPQNSNATEEGRAKNRRVDIFTFKIKDGQIALKGKSGMEMAVRKDFFAPCGVCETNPKLNEVFTNEQASRAGIPMTTTDGESLITGGMIDLSFNCRERIVRDKSGKVDSLYCATVKIRIPAASFDEDMEIWNSQPTGQGREMSRWAREQAGQLEYDDVAKEYIMTVRMCPGDRKNLDKIAPPGGLSRVTSNPWRDTAAVVALPELTRPLRRNQNYSTSKSTILTSEGTKTVTMARFNYRGKVQLAFADSGMSKEKIGYYYSGTLDGYEMECDSARCSRRQECWCYEIPLSAYTKIIYFQKNKDFRLKVPLKYRNYSVRLFIPAADSILEIKALKQSKRKYTFQQPLPNTYVVLYKKSSDANNKRSYDYQVDLEKVRKKYNKRKKVYKAKIKNKQLKSSV